MERGGGEMIVATGKKGHGTVSSVSRGPAHVEQYAPCVLARLSLSGLRGLYVKACTYWQYEKISPHFNKEHTS
jgi:hypothetical protein